MLVPSFSSKGFPELGIIVETLSEFIEGPTLVSAYDVEYGGIKPPLAFPSVLFLDSGGYEASKENELSDVGDKSYKPRAWSPEQHELILKNWVSSPAVPLVVISYDHPKDRSTIDNQIERAKKSCALVPGAFTEILIKPFTEASIRLDMDEIIKNIDELKKFDVIGITEKECGKSIFDRMVNIAKLRRALDSVGAKNPIHIFGSLDTVSSVLYFLSGADIFDGLTWLRYAYFDGTTSYKQVYGAEKLGIKTNSDLVDAHCWTNNLRYLVDLESQMKRFTAKSDFNVFEHHRELFEKAHADLAEHMGI
jgi:hypothetical protein